MKEEFIYRIIHSPESLTEEDIQLIQDDQDLCELYEQMVLLNEAGRTLPAFDVDAGLAEIHRSAKSVSFIPKWGRVAAIIVFSIMTTAIASVLVREWIVPKVKEPSTCPQETLPLSSNHSEDSTMVVPNLSEDPIRYDHLRLEEILEDISRRYDCQVIYKNEAVKSVRFHVTIPTETTLEQVVELFNCFDQVHLSLNDHIIKVE